MLAACAAIGPAHNPIEAPEQWHGSAITAHAADSPGGAIPWYQRLHDPAVDDLVAAAMQGSPDIGGALARIDAARAATAGANAAAWPSLTATTTATRARVQTSSNGSRTGLASQAIGNVGLAWEIDLFGRLRSTRDAARQRLDARSAEAAATRLVVAAQVAQDVLEWRACVELQRTRSQDLASREATRDLVGRRLSAGLAPRLDAARANNDLAQARAILASQQQACGVDIDALVALTGRPWDEVRTALQRPPRKGLKACLFDASGEASCSTDAAQAVLLPEPPPAAPLVPAIALASQPQVVAAQREADAAWAELGATRAARYPRLDLSALLSGQWLRIGGQSLTFPVWSAGPALSLPLFDGGAAQSNVDAAEARYREAVANLRGTVLAATRDVENALLASAASETRLEASMAGIASAREAWQIAERQWRAGASSLLDLEDARRQFSIASVDAIGAVKARTQAWVELVKAIGDHGVVFEAFAKEGS